MSLFGDMRSLAHQDPSAWIWRELGALCELLQGVELERAVDYALPMLARWPDALRVCPAGWLSRWLEGDDWPPLAMVRHIAYLRELEIEPWLDVMCSPWFSTLTGLMVPADGAVETWEATHEGSALQRLDLWRATAGLAARVLGHLPVLRRLYLSASPPCTLDALIEAIAPTLGRLHELTLSAQGLSQSGIAQLSQEASPDLKALAVVCYDCSDRLASDLVEAQGLQALERLTLYHCNVSTRTTERIRDARLLGELRELHLGGNAIADEGWQALAGCHHLAHLRALTLPRSSMHGGSALPRLAEADWPSMRELTVLGGSGLSALITLLERAPWTAQLRKIEIVNCPLAREDVARLAALPLHAIEHLRLEHVGLDSEGATGLARASWLAGLRHLNLRRNPIGTPGLEAIAARLASIVFLDLGFCEIDDRGLAALLQDAQLGDLRELVLLGNTIGPEGAAALAQQSELPMLEWVELRHNRITRTGHRTLAGATHLHPRIRSHYASSGGVV